MNFSFELQYTTYLLIALSLVFTMVFLWWKYRNYKTLRDAVAECEDEEESRYLNEEELPGVSVIVYAKNDAEYLVDNLPLILNQDYPNFEVIVVNNGYADGSKDLLSDMELQYPNLYQTFLPEDTRALSKKKLAIMLGIKAAKKEIILTTNANCAPQSQQWLRKMMRNFVPGVDVVIGYSKYDYSEDHTLSRWFRRFHFLRKSVQYLTYAIKGKPFRGTSDNLAYRKDSFFNNKGFSRSMNLHYGDDDLFITEIANEDNTRVELSEESVIVAHYYYIKKMYCTLTMRRDFTSKYIKTSAFAVSGIMTAVYIFNLLVMAAIIALNYTNPFALAIAVVLDLLLVIPQICLYRKQAQVLYAPRLWFSIPFFAVWSPLVNWGYKLRGSRHRTSNFTWQRN